MKKSILTLILALVGLFGFSQTYVNTVGVSESSTKLANKNVTFYSNPSNVINASTFLYVNNDYSDSTKNYFYNAGGQLNAYKKVTATYTAAYNNFIINDTLSSDTVKLPTSVGHAGQQFVIKNSSAGSIVIDPYSTQTIDGASTKTVTTKKTIWVVFDGANVVILSYN